MQFIKCKSDIYFTSIAKTDSNTDHIIRYTYIEWSWWVWWSTIKPLKYQRLIQLQSIQHQQSLRHRLVNDPGVRTGTITSLVFPSRDLPQAACGKFVLFCPCCGPTVVYYCCWQHFIRIRWLDYSLCNQIQLQRGFYSNIVFGPCLANKDPC